MGLGSGDYDLRYSRTTQVLSIEVTAVYSVSTATGPVQVRPRTARHAKYDRISGMIVDTATAIYCHTPIGHPTTQTSSNIPRGTHQASSHTRGELEWTTDTPRRGYCPVWQAWTCTTSSASAIATTSCFWCPGVRCHPPTFHAPLHMMHLQDRTAPKRPCLARKASNPVTCANSYSLKQAFPYIEIRPPNHLLAWSLPSSARSLSLQLRVGRRVRGSLVGRLGRRGRVSRLDGWRSRRAHL